LEARRVLRYDRTRFKQPTKDALMTENKCIFCEIAAGRIPSTILYNDNEIMAFEDIQPVAPVHFLVIPKVHIPTLDDVDDAHQAVLGRMMVVASKVARDKGVGATGYRQIINCRESAGQVVFHLHLHVIGGREMGRMG